MGIRFPLTEKMFLQYVYPLINLEACNGNHFKQEVEGVWKWRILTKGYDKKGFHFLHLILHIECIEYRQVYYSLINDVYVSVIFCTIQKDNGLP